LVKSLQIQGLVEIGINKTGIHAQFIELKAGDEHDRCIRLRLADPLRYFESVEVGQLVIQQDYVES